MVTADQCGQQSPIYLEACYVAGGGGGGCCCYCFYCVLLVLGCAICVLGVHQFSFEAYAFEGEYIILNHVLTLYVGPGGDQDQALSQQCGLLEFWSGGV